MTIYRGVGGGGNDFDDTTIAIFEGIAAQATQSATSSSASAASALVSKDAAAVSAAAALVSKDSAAASAVAAQTSGSAIALAANLAASGGSALVGYLPAGTGAVAKTVQSELRENVTPEHFGAVGNGVADDTVALGLLVNYVNTGAAMRVSLKGLYKSTQPLSFTSNNFALDFKIQGESGLSFVGCNGVIVTQSDKYAAFSSNGMLLITDSINLYTGFSYINSVVTTGDAMPKFSNGLVCIGKDRLNATGILQGWLTCVSISNGDRFYIDDCWLQGAEQSRVDAFPILTTGIFATGSTQLVIRNPAIFICETAISVTGQSEGLEVVRGTLVANKKGINFNPTVSPANDTNITGVHIASMDYNIRLAGSEPTIMHNVQGCLLFTRTEAYVSSTFKHIIVDGMSQITENFFFTATATTPPNHIGIDIIAAASGITKNVAVIGNAFYRIPTLVNIAATVANTVVTSNNTNDDAATVLVAPVVDAGTDTTVGFNYGDRDFGEAKSDTGVFWSPSASPGFYVGNSKLKCLTATQGSASAVNYVDVVNAATGAGVIVRALGTDAAVDLVLSSKGVGTVRPEADNTKNLGSPSFRWSNIYGGVSTVTEVRTDIVYSVAGSPGFYVGAGKLKCLTATQGSASAVNFVDVVNSATGVGVLIRASGTDASIDLQLSAKGPGSSVKPDTDNLRTFGKAANRWLEVYGTTLKPGAGTVVWTSSTGTPEGVVTAPVGSLFTRTDGGANTTLYIKETGVGNTGWVAK